MRASGLAAAVAVVLLVFLPLFYLLSLGPATWLYERGMMSDDVAQVLGWVYSPLDWMERKSPAISRPLQAYVELWQPARAVPSRPPTTAPLPPAASPPPAAATPSSPAANAESS